MKIGRLEILWHHDYRPYPSITESKDLSGALAVPETNDMWRAVHQVVNEIEQETIEASRRLVANTNSCISAIGSGEGAALVRRRLIEKRENAIDEASKLRRAG
jgi:hypothetical protein